MNLADQLQRRSVYMAPTQYIQVIPSTSLVLSHLNATFLYLAAGKMNSCLLLRKSCQSSKDHSNCEPHLWCGLCSMLISAKGLVWHCDSQCSQHHTACRITIMSSTPLHNKPVNQPWVSTPTEISKEPAPPWYRTEPYFWLGWVK